MTGLTIFAIFQNSCRYYWEITWIPTGPRLAIVLDAAPFFGPLVSTSLSVVQCQFWWCHLSRHSCTWPRSCDQGCWDYYQIPQLRWGCLVPLGHLIEDSLQLISSFRSFAFSHVKRKGNCVADKLAKLAKGSPLSQIWLEDIHNDATNLVMFVRSFGWFIECMILFLKKRKRKMSHI